MRLLHIHRFLLLLVLLLGSGLCRATNVTLGPPMLIDYNEAADYVDVRFNISWQNSWRTSSAPGNWDAAWVFFKFRVGGSDPTRTGVSSAGSTLNVGSTAGLRVGMPVLRTAGTGTLPANVVISAIPNATQVTLSAAPSAALSGATVRFIRIWEPVRLANDVSHVAPAGATIRTGLLNPAGAFNATTNYGVGAFIYRSANGTGTFTANNVELRWNHGLQGLGYGSQLEICGFAQEMVYVTGGNFRVGSGGNSGSNGEFYQQPTAGSTYQITSEAAITVGTGSGNLYYGPSTFNQPGDQLGPIPAAFPKGHGAFYCMKYELTQGDYVDFLNKLTRQQQASRVATAIGTGTTAVTNRYVMSNSTAIPLRNGIRCPATISATDPITFYCDLSGNGVGNEVADGQWIACGYLLWTDLSAYLDWAGLRPMTELEFEKACRGPLTPVLNECAWGTTGIAGALYGLSNMGRNNEQVATGYTTAQGNAVYGATNWVVPTGSGSGSAYFIGPLRVGMLAHHASNTGRITAGAGYYGALDLSGNIDELTITTGRPAGRAFTGAHGNGGLDQAGAHDAAGWPTGYLGWGLRGGNYSTSANRLAISGRWIAADFTSSREAMHGGRGVRTLP
ncbi:MAG: hypothetical protein KA230_11415 [Flavobacteriales bacterium]|nr:hypothetical protein [Flavobacteriales bacterium]